MEIKSLRELLLKKAEDNPYLQTLIEYAREDVLIDQIIESLKKMAEPSAAMGRFANSALTSYGGQMDNTDVEQVRDALAHHISHYKSALKNDKRDVADQHLNKIVPLMHLAGRASKHSGGKAVLDYRSMTPWETNYTTPDRISEEDVAANGKGTAGKLKEGTKDLARRPKGDHPGSGSDVQSRIKQRDGNRNVPDYRYLEMPPHAGHDDTKNLPGKGGYPFEDIQFGSPAKRDMGQAYLPIEDVGPQDKFVPHPFDSHPLFAKHPKHGELHDRAEVSAKQSISDEEREKFATDLAGWKSGPEHKQWLQSQKDKFAKDPEAYKQRGMTKPEHHFTGIQLHEPPKHATDAAAAAPQQDAAPAVPQQDAAPSAIPSSKAPGAPPTVIRRPAGGPMAKPDMSKLDPKLLARLKR
jgi:hypothetical protein